MRQDKPNIIIDTNTLFGAMCADIAPAEAKEIYHVDLQVVTHAFAHFTVCATERTMAELEKVCFDPNDHKQFLPGTARQRMLYVANIFQPQMHKVEPHPSRLRCNAKDQMFLEAAAGAQAAFLMTRDQGILFLKRWNRQLFLHPEDYRQRYMPSLVPAPVRSGGVKQPYQKLGNN